MVVDNERGVSRGCGQRRRSPEVGTWLELMGSMVVAGGDDRGRERGRIKRERV